MCSYTKNIGLCGHTFLVLIRSCKARGSSQPCQGIISIYGPLHIDKKCPLCLGETEMLVSVEAVSPKRTEVRCIDNVADADKLALELKTET